MIDTNNEGLRLAQQFCNRMLFVAGYDISATHREAAFLLGKKLSLIGLDKFHAVYPLIGESASRHALDFMGQYDITWSGTITHNSQGSAGNGSTGYGDTGLDPSTVMDDEDAHISCYLESNGFTGTDAYVGGGDSAGTGLILLGNVDVGSKQAGGIGVDGTVSPDEYAPDDGDADTSADHFHVIDATASKSQQYYRDGVAFGDPVTATAALDNDDLYLMARNVNSVASLHCNGTMKFFSIGKHLTAAEHALLYDACLSFNQVLLREL